MQAKIRKQQKRTTTTTTLLWSDREDAFVSLPSSLKVIYKKLFYLSQRSCKIGYTTLW
ncbi:hypothetical protein P389DRAFT_5318 [Cystobasidium minutum MCA 4210]|uniref:uncharacterized protein n=1 Tax=Cystobasidium minutum MCA 4210 TaxID=1397322 RepID=UPI0034CF0623|eukprot:jgi/Rhomi1/5318/CE5317_903